MSVSPKKLLEALGVQGPEALGRVVFTRGVIGRVTWIVIVALGVMGIAATRLDDRNSLALLILVGIVALVAAGAVVTMFLFASRNPQLALLEGSELIAWRQMVSNDRGN
jgi:hypothetical protein